MKKLLFTGGGSAGHTIPNIALMQELKEDFLLTYVGSNGIEKELLKNKGVPFYTIACTKLIRGNIFKNLLLPFRYFKSIQEAKKVLKEIQPNLIFSKGGFVALPVVKAAKKLKIPVITHESDLSLGLANKFIVKDSAILLTSFPETATHYKNGIYSGPPIRKELFHGNKADGLRAFHLSGKKPILLIFGGGSGSKIINASIQNCLPALLQEFEILHIYGKNPPESTENYHVVEFVKDMKDAFAVADFVLSRAGSNSVFECLALKKATLFIPLENRRTRGDQIENSLYFQKKGLCHILREKELNAGSLLEALLKLKEDRQLRKNLENTNIASGNARIIQSIRTCIE